MAGRNVSTDRLDGAVVARRGEFHALRSFALDSTDHAFRREHAAMLRRDIHWRNRHAHDRALRELAKLANGA